MSGLKFICSAAVAVSLFGANGGELGPNSVARIGEQYYDSLQAAFDDAKAGDDVVLVRDVVWRDAKDATLLSVAAGKSFRLDLNGLSVVATNSLADASQLFAVRGSLTIDDTSAGATGRIAFNPLTPSVYTKGMPSYVSNVFTVKGGAITLCKGTIVNDGTGGACYVFDVGGSGSTASAITVSNGTVRAVNTVARLWATDLQTPERFTIAGGTVVSEKNSGIQFFGIRNTPTTGTTEIRMTGGTLKAAITAVYVYESQGGVTVDLSGGSVATTAEADSRPAVVYACASGDPVRGRPHDKIALSGNVALTGKKDGVYLYDCAGEIDFSMACVYGYVSVDERALFYYNTRPNTNGYDRASLSVSGGYLSAKTPFVISDAGGGLTAEISGGTIWSTQNNAEAIKISGSKAHPDDGRHTELTISGGTIGGNSNYILGIVDEYAAYDVLITGGDFYGWVYIKGWNCSDPHYERTDGPWVTVTGGTFGDFGVYYDPKSSYSAWLADPNLSGFTLYGGTYNTRIATTDACRMGDTYVYVPSEKKDSWDIVPGVAVSAQTVVNASWKLYTYFDEEIQRDYPYAAWNTDVTAVWTSDKDYVFPADAMLSSNTVPAATNPTVVPAIALTSPLAVASVNGVVYPSLAAAYAAASAGQRITLLRDITATEPFVIEHPTLIDLNGHSYVGPKDGSFSVVGTTTLKITATAALGGSVTGPLSTNGTSRILLFAGSYDTNVTNFDFVATGYTTEDENPWKVVAKSSKTDYIDLKKDGEDVTVATISTEALTENAVSPEDVNDIGANGITVWESIVLGLDSADATSLPWVKPVQQTDSKKLVVEVQEVVENDRVEGASITYVLYGSNSRRSDAVWTELGRQDHPQFDVERVGGSYYKYYMVKTEIEFEE